jgi:hypothetical protein
VKQLTITLTLPITPDEFGLHTIPDGTREWLGLLRIGAEENGCTVAMEVEDGKGLQQVRKRPRKPRAPVVSLVPNDAA